MTHTIEKKELPPTPFLYMRTEVKPDAMSDALASMLPAVFQYAMENGLTFAGPPITRYANYGPELMTIEAGLPITASDNTGTDDILIGELVGGPVASTVHKGPYDGLGDAHAAVHRWLESEGVKPAGAPWEIYLTDPGEVPDPADWLTELIYPIEG